MKAENLKEGKHMSLENAKKFIKQAMEDETLRERTANKGEEEILAIAKEMGLDYTAEELKEAAGVRELDLSDMEPVAGGDLYGMVKDFSEPLCPKSKNGEHKWIKTGHYESEWFSWLKKGGIFSIGYDTFKCEYCGKKKEVST